MSEYKTALFPARKLPCQTVDKYVQSHTMYGTQHLPKKEMPWQKRVFDVTVTGLLVIMLLPLLLLVVLAIYLEKLISKKARGSVLYKETRMSQGKPFNFMKFRSFTIDALKQAQKKHGFIHTKPLEKKHLQTKVGYILTKFYLDEIPQLFSVLKGDISLIGPRPVNLEVYLGYRYRYQYNKDIVKAGLTGHFQSYKNQTDRTDVDMDYEYISWYDLHWFKLIKKDIHIIWRTIRLMLRGEGL